MSSHSDAIAVAPAGKNQELQIDYHGKKYRLFRPGGAGNWIIRVERHGRSHVKSLGTPLPKIAEKNAKAFLDALFSENWAEKIAPMRLKTRSVARVADLLHCYETYAASELVIAPRSVSGNVGRLEAILRAVFPDIRDVRDLRCDQITEDTFRRFVRESRARGVSEASIRSTISQARSVISPKLKHLYAAHITVPNSLFTLQISIQGAKDATTEPFRPIPQETLLAMEAAILDESPNVRRCYLLMSRLGLRNSEVLACRPSWFEMRGSRRLLILRDRPEEHFWLKNSLPGSLEVPYDLWRRLTEDLPADAAYLIHEKTATDRAHVTHRAINAFVRRFLPDRQKASYELRKLAGSIVATRTGSLYAAQSFLRHKNHKTTEMYYATYLKTIGAVTPEDISAIYCGPAVEPI